jgi:hypothetical protein
MFLELARLAAFLGLCLELVSGCEDGHHSRPPQRSAPLTPQRGLCSGGMLTLSIPQILMDGFLDTRKNLPQSLIIGEALTTVLCL